MCEGRLEDRILTCRLPQSSSLVPATTIVSRRGPVHHQPSEFFRLQPAVDHGHPAIRASNNTFAEPLPSCPRIIIIIKKREAMFF